MADIALRTADRVEVVGIPVDQVSGTAGEDITAGAPCAFNSSGNIVNSDANSTVTALNKCAGIALTTVNSGEAVTLLKQGRLDGYSTGAIAHGAGVFLSNTVGRIADTSPNTSTALKLGEVEAVKSNQLANGSNKVINIHLPLTF